MQHWKMLTKGPFRKHWAAETFERAPRFCHSSIANLPRWEGGTQILPNYNYPKKLNNSNKVIYEGLGIFPSRTNYRFRGRKDCIVSDDLQKSEDEGYCPHQLSNNIFTEFL